MPRLEVLEARINPGMFFVDNLGDTGKGTDATHGDLRFCIGAANASLGASSISFSPGVTGTITLALGALPTFSVNIWLGTSVNQPITVDGTGRSQIFSTATGTDDEIDNLTITGGYTAGNGAGIKNAGSLTLGNCVIQSCTAGGTGGGIYNGDNTLAALTLINTSLYDNAAPYGGGISNAGGQVTINSGSQIINNSAAIDGGGIVSTGGWVAIGDNVAVNGNSASRNGGGIANYASLTMGYSSLSGNRSEGLGGGLYTGTTGASATLTGTDIEYNSATTAGGGFYLASGNLTLDSCTVSNNTAPLGNGGAYHKPATPTLQGQMVITDSIVPDNP